MSVQFDEPASVSRSSGEEKVPMLYAFFISLGLVKTPAGAQVVAVVVAVVCLGIAGFLLMSAGGELPPPPPPPPPTPY